MNRALSLYIEQETRRVGTASAVPPSQPPNPSPSLLATVADPVESQGATNTASLFAPPQRHYPKPNPALSTPQ